MNSLCFLGLSGIIGPPREEVAEAVDECHSTQVKVMMVTGDHPITALAISKSINIITH